MRDFVAPLSALVEPVREMVITGKDRSLPYVGLEHLESDRSRVASTGLSEDSISINVTFRPGDILFGKLRPNLHKSIIVDFPGYCSTELIVLRPKPMVDPSYAGWILRSEHVFAEAVRTAEGTRMPRSSWSRLQNLHVRCPPQVEQQRIAEVLDDADSLIQAVHGIIEKIHLRLAAMIAALFGNIDPSQTMAYVLERNPTNGLYKPASDYSDNGVPIVRIDSIHDGEIGDLGALRRVNLDVAERNEFSIQKGDILVNRVNSIDFVGKSAIVRAISEPCVFESNIMQCRVREDLARPHFVALWLSTPAAMSYFRSCAKSAIAQASINQQDVRSCPIPLPSLDDQDSVIACLESARCQEEVRKQKLSKLKEIKQGLMDDLLSGRVRVPARLLGGACSPLGCNGECGRRLGRASGVRAAWFQGRGRLSF